VVEALFESVYATRTCTISHDEPSIPDFSNVVDETSIMVGLSVVSECERASSPDRSA